MEKLIKARKMKRASAEKIIDQVHEELQNNMVTAQAKFFYCQLEQAERELKVEDEKIFDKMLARDEDEEVFAKELDEVREFSGIILKIKIQLEEILENRQLPQSSTISQVPANIQGNSRKNMLPRIKIKEFGGDMENWISWWSWFEKIHEDKDLDEIDKFQYLTEAVKHGTEAHRILKNYAISKENYHEVIDVFKLKFGNNIMLILMYMRDILQFVVNSANKKDKKNLKNVHEKLDGFFRSLKSLGVDVKNAALALYPFIEFSMPEDILQQWMRTDTMKNLGKQPSDPNEKKQTPAEWFVDTFEKVMSFLQDEVQGQERMAIVKKGLENNSNKIVKPRTFDHDEELPTAAGLLSKKQEKPNYAQNYSKRKCIFCQMDSHSSLHCMKARSMDFPAKENIIRSKGLCFTCLEKGHISSDCSARMFCGNCQRRHPTVLCPGKQPKETKVAKLLNCSEEVILQTLQVKLVNGKKSIQARAVIDSGSQTSHILTKTAKKLGLKPDHTINIIHEVFGGGNHTANHGVFALEIQDLDGTFRTSIEVMDEKKICNSIPRMKMGPWLGELKKKKIWLTDLGHESPEIDILLGADVYVQILTADVHKLRNGLAAVRTRLGWTVIGKVGVEKMSEPVSTSVSMLQCQNLSVADLWKLDTLGIMDPIEVKSKNQEEQLAKDSFLGKLSKDEDGRYTVGLPWIDGHKMVPNNKKLAEMRLQSTIAKLEKIGMFEQYDKILEDWKREGLIEEVHDYEKDNCFYLPHRAVVKPESTTTPVRPVFDGSCRSSRNPSINDCLFKGPNLLEQIPAVLLQFRQGKIGVLADIRKAFQMIGILSEDRDYLRFLWWDRKKHEHIIYRHARVPFGINSSPFLLAATLDYHLRNVSPKDKETANKILSSLYVDNVCTSVNSMDEYQQFEYDAIRIMADGSFDLRQWEYNLVSPGVGARSACGLGTEVSSTTPVSEKSSVLGLVWDKEEDMMSCKINTIQVPEKMTKRTILSILHKVYDPIGFTVPALVKPKILVQKLWSEKLGWDTDLPEDIKMEFVKWSSELDFLEYIKIPRCFTSNGEIDNAQLHMFCDASQEAYAAVVYLRTGDPGNVNIQLVQAKSRVSPMSKPTIPRLELLGCTIGSRLVTKIRNDIGVPGIPVKCWTDSSTCIAWIKHNDNWGTFVGNRVKEICSLTQVENWSHVPGVQNPADLPSRGCTPKELLMSRWWEGPDWLYKSEEFWPGQLIEFNEQEINLEKKKSSVALVQLQKEDILPKFSSFTKNVRVLAWVLRYIGKLKKVSSDSGELTSDELRTAENTIWKIVQEAAFQKVGGSLNGIKLISKDGLLCVQTKLTNSQEVDQFKYPVLLPSSHPMVETLIQEYHRKNCHGGVQFLMSRLRENYWILKARKTVKIVSSCVKCRRYSSKPLEVPSVGLPLDRVMDGKPFQVTGIDLAGPLFLKGKTKVWIVLFTCAIYRGVHLELVKSLATEDFLLALSRFMSRKGRPATIHTDNGTNFVGANNLFQEIDWTVVQRETSHRKIQWKFIPPSAAWWGGYWERLIRSLKDLLKRMLGNQKLNYVQLETCLTEAEAVMNARPLTYIAEDPEDLVPLTPALFMGIGDNTAITELEELNAGAIRKEYGKLQQLRKELRMRFRNEYLGVMAQRSKDIKMDPIEVGEVVLVGSDNMKRIDWPIARVEEVVSGRDGVPRIAWIRIGNGGRLMRPVQRLFRLEMKEAIKPSSLVRDIAKMTIPTDGEGDAAFHHYLSLVKFMD